MLLQIRVVVETEIEEGKRVRLDAFTLVVNAHVCTVLIFCIAGLLFFVP